MVAQQQTLSPATRSEVLKKEKQHVKALFTRKSFRMKTQNLLIDTRFVYTKTVKMRPKIFHFENAIQSGNFRKHNKETQCKCKRQKCDLSGVVYDKSRCGFGKGMVEKKPVLFVLLPCCCITVTSESDDYGGF